MVNPFVNDTTYLQTVYQALREAGCTQQEPSLGDVWLASAQLALASSRRLFQAALSLEQHIHVWKKRSHEHRSQQRREPPASGNGAALQLEDLQAPFQKAEVLKWIQRACLATLAQVHAAAAELQLAEYLKGSQATQFLLRCAMPEQSRTLLQAACRAVGNSCHTISSVLERLEVQVKKILSRPCEELADFHTAVLHLLLKNRILSSGFRPVYDDGTAGEKLPQDFTMASACEAVKKLQLQLEVTTVCGKVAPRPKPSSAASPCAEPQPTGGLEGRLSPAAAPVTEPAAGGVSSQWLQAAAAAAAAATAGAGAGAGVKQEGAGQGSAEWHKPEAGASNRDVGSWPLPKSSGRVSVAGALSQAGRQAGDDHLITLPKVLVPENRVMRRLRRVCLAVGIGWLLQNVARVGQVAKNLTTSVVVPSAAIRLPLKIKQLSAKAPIVDPKRLEREKSQLQKLQVEIMASSRQLKDESQAAVASEQAKRINLGAPPSEVESDDDAELVMMHALHGASEAMEDGFMSKLSGLSSLNPAHLLKVASFVVKRTKVQAQDMLLRLDNISRTNNLILSLLTAAPPLILSLAIHWFITRRLIWVNARPGSNFLLTLHAQMHVVGCAVKAWAASPERADLQGRFLYELAKASKICMKMMNRSRGVCHHTLVTLLHQDMVALAAPAAAADKCAQFDSMMSTNPLLKDSA